MYRKTACILVYSTLLLGAACLHDSRTKQNWTHFVRTAGHGLSLDRVDSIVRSATDTHVFGIETDNDIPGRYESFLDPEEKLKAIETVAQKAHAAGNYAFVYIAGLECITADADQTEHTFFKDHPDWVQRKITGEPAVFGGGTAFWISKGDEDIWISPFAPAWRKIYMERVRQIARTGIDGVYVDIPYWMTHFDGWEDTWASFDDYTIEAFRKTTDLDARKDLRLGDFSDTNFRRWVDFRIGSLTAFMKEIDDNVKAVNPECKTIAEIYPGIEEDAVRVGADVYDLYPVVDVIAHEYSAGGYTAAARDALDWLWYMTGMFTFRAFAEGKASWMLSYSWDGEKDVSPSDAMKNLFISQLTAGTNCWDARGHVMSGSNDYETRKEVYRWIAQNEKTFYSPREPVQPTGVYFSPKSRDYFVRSFIPSFRGWMAVLLQSHLEFQIVTPRTLSRFHGKTLILPETRCLSSGELEDLQALLASGTRILFTGEAGKYDGGGAEWDISPVAALSEKMSEHLQQGGIQILRECPGSSYYRLLKKSDHGATVSEPTENPEVEAAREEIVSQFLYRTGTAPEVIVDVSPFVITQISRVKGKTLVFLANFKGLEGLKNSVPLPESGIRLTLAGGKKRTVHYLPYLGERIPVPVESSGSGFTCILPDVERGGVVIIE